MIKVFGKPLRVNKAASDKKQIDVGANLFVGNLDPNVDERTLYETFSQFGIIVQPPKIQRDDEGNSRGFGFVNFADFEASDAAIEAMNGQHLMGKQVNVSYALKKDGKGERHGSAAERLLAAQRKKNQPQVGSRNARSFLFSHRRLQFIMGMGMGMPGMPGMMPGMPFGMPPGMTGANNMPLGGRY